MSTLQDATRDFAEANARADAARQAASEAQSIVDDLTARLATGDATITADELASAKATAEHAQLTAQGAEAPLQRLHAELKAARADETCDRIGSDVRELGTTLVGALDRLPAVLEEIEAAAAKFDRYVAESGHLLDSLGGSTPRVVRQRYRQVAVDGVELGSANADRHVAQMLAPALKALGAPGFALENLQELARGARPIPTREAS